MLPSNANPPSIRVGFTRTQGEWDKLDQIFLQNHSEFHSYVRRESSRLRNLAKVCLPCVTPATGPKINRRHQIPTEIYNDLLYLAQLRGISIGHLLNDLLITPLLLPDKDAAL